MFQVGSRMTHNVLVVKKHMNIKDIRIREACLSDAEAIVDLIREHAAGAGETAPSLLPMSRPTYNRSKTVSFWRQ